MSFKRALDAEIAALKEKAKPKKHRFKNGYRKTETIRFFMRPSDPRMVQVRLTHDLVMELWRWRDKWVKPNEEMPDYIRQTIRLEFLAFPDGIPGCLMRIEKPYHYEPNGRRLRQTPGAWTWDAKIRASKIGLKDGLTSRAVEFFPWEAEGGYVLMLEPHELNHGPTMTTDEFADVIGAEIENPDHKTGWM